MSSNEPESAGSARAAEDRFNALAEQSRDVIFELGSDTKLTYVSPSAEAVLGVDAAQLVGLDLATLAATFEVAPKEQVGGFAGPWSLDELVARGPYQRVRSIRGPDGRIRWIDIAVTQFETVNSESRATAVVRDITDRIQLEEQRLRSQKFESMGILAGGVAHMFNNLLTGILGNVELAIADVEASDNAGVLPLLWEIVAAASRAEESTEQLLIYAGKGTLEMSPLDLSDEIRSMRSLLRSVADRRVAFDFEFREWLPTIQADAAQLSQVLLNLVSNAVEACAEKGGAVVVSTGTVVLEEESASAIHSGVPPGTYVFVAVRDDGEGIDADVQAKVFDPFFTTRAIGRGLGLAASLGIARAHGGTIIVDSKPGQGSVFKVLFPVSGQHLEATPSPATADLRGEGLILVVDDEDTVGRLACGGLKRFGYDVLSANSGKQALALFAEHSGDIDLLVTDLAMPEMNGEELLAEIRLTHPDLPVLLMSGYGRSSVTETLANLRSVEFIQKPFLPSELAAGVRRVMNSALKGHV